MRPIASFLCLLTVSLATTARAEDAPGAPSPSPPAPAPAAAKSPAAQRGPEVPDPTPWLDVTGATLAGVSRDGSTVLIRMSHAGVTQIFRLGRDGGWPRRLTFRTEGVDSAALSRDGKQVVLSYDKDGDENYALFLRPTADGGTETPLDVVPGVQRGGVHWSRDGSRVFYRSNEASRADFAIVERTVATGAARTVLSKPGRWAIEDVDRAGTRLLVSFEPTTQTQSIHVLDLSTGALAEIDPPGPGVTAIAGDARFVGDGDDVLFLSDRGGEWTRAFVVSLATRAVREIDAPAGDVEGAALSDDGKVVALGVNVGGRTRVAVREVATGKALPAPDVGDAIVSAGRFDDRGSLFFTITRPDTPGTVMRWDGGGADAVPLTFPDFAGLSESSYAFAPTLVTFPSFDGREIPAWLYLPRGRDPKDLPFVLSIHGGPEGQERPAFNAERAYLLSQGFGVLAPNVRGSTGYGRTYCRLDDCKGRMDSVRDAKAAADFLVAKGYANPKRIAVTGGSYGGFMVLALLTEYPETFAAGAEAVGISNFETFLERTAPYRRAHRESEYGSLSDREFLRSISPIHRVDRIRAPLLIGHGVNDPRVPVHEAKQIEAALKALNRPVEAIYFPDEGHGWRKRNNRRTWTQRVAQFLTKHLKG